MKAIIPCAGRGERLRPLTFTNSKPLIPIANKSLVLYAIEAIKEVGIRKIGLVVGENESDLRQVLKNGNDLGVEISYIHQDEPRGIADTVKVSRRFLGNSPFVMYLGDNLLQRGLTTAVKQFHDNRAGAVLLLSRTEKPQLYGVAEIENDRVIRIHEKPKTPPSNLAAVGIYVFDSSIHSIIDHLAPSERGEMEITDAIQKLIDGGAKVEYHIVEGWWVDAGTPEDMIEANRLVLQNLQTGIDGSVDSQSEIRGNVVIGKGSCIERSKIRGPVIIGDDCRITGAFVGSFTSIGSRSALSNCEVEYSVIMQNCEIRDVEERIDYSILGRNVRLTSNVRRPRSYKLVLSDNSSAELR
ncbi:MAG: glucose-1-phosphate thymidylyltransferase [Candidatus Omnitrophota bacterium]|nr:MAG: glucose-1-phosphate thymidylyltransferase [Candidatus Omnitrophota bacterium]